MKRKKSAKQRVFEAATERPIIFSSPMVRAILDGRKTQTRRLVKPQPKIILAVHSDASITTERIFRSGDQRIHCPYGQPGDRLWVRETFSLSGNGYFFRADVPQPETVKYSWNPSIHMPRWASRITLEIINIRVERLQEISEKDANAEGVGTLFKYGMPAGRSIDCFHALWDSINAKRAPWASNPFVWVIEFKLITSRLG